MACIMSTPALFLAAPLLVLDCVRALRSRAKATQVVAATETGILILAHLALFVLRQNALTTASGWDPQFMPHHGLSRQISFVLDGLKGFVDGAFTATYQSAPTGSWILVVCFALLLALGFAHLTRSAKGRSVVLAIVGAFLLTL